MTTKKPNIRWCERWECHNSLPPRRRRFCSNTCLENHWRDKKRAARFSTKPDWCAWCGESLPPRKRRFCSRTCFLEHQKDMRRALNSGKTCLCGAPIHVESEHCHACANRIKAEEQGWPKDRCYRVRAMISAGASFTEIARLEHITQRSVSGWLYRQPWYRDLRRNLTR